MDDATSRTDPDGGPVQHTGLARRRSNALTELVRIRAGADFTNPDPGVQRSPGQLWGHLLGLGGADRMELLAHLLSSSYDGWMCRGIDHAGQVERLYARVAQLVVALEFYGSPDTYHAIGFMAEPPCGAFTEDWSVHEDPDYPSGDERPGKRARQALGWEPGDQPVVLADVERWRDALQAIAISEPADDNPQARALVEVARTALGESS